jgi:glycerophosphoryl diester phosphodiesterase
LDFSGSGRVYGFFYFFFFFFFFFERRLIDAIDLQTFQEITSDQYLSYIKRYVVGLGPWKDTLVPPTPGNYLGTPTDLIKRAHAQGLQVSLSLSVCLSIGS